MSTIQDSAGSPQPVIGSAAPVDLDLAFSAAEGLPPELLQTGGIWLDHLQGEQAWQAQLGGWLAQLAAELPAQLRSGAYSLGLSLVDDAEIAALNGDWRGKPGPTDVLAFAAQDDDLEGAPPLPMPVWAGGSEEGEPLDAAQDEDQAAWQGEPLELGDIVISVPTAARQASEHGHDLVRELLFLASHGLLHLLGWDHPDEASLAAMLVRQEALLASLPADPARLV